MLDGRWVTKKVTIGVALVLCVANLLAQGVTRSVVTPDHAEPSADLSVILSYAQAVVVGRVLSQEQDFNKVGDRPFPIVRHKVEVTEVAKGDPALVAGAIIEVIQPGGTARLDTVEVTVSDPDFPVFAIGSRYVFILRKSGSAYSSYAGPATVFAIGGGDRVRVPKGAAHIDDLRSHMQDTVGALMSFLRAKAQRGRGGVQ